MDRFRRELLELFVVLYSISELTLSDLSCHDKPGEQCLTRDRGEGI